jgi:hypothetical protein
MNEQNKALAESWIAAQQATWEAFLSIAPAPVGGSLADKASPLQEQFDELRNTWQASVSRWTEFAKEAAQGQVPSVNQLREMFSPASWTGAGSGGLDTALQRLLEGPRYAVLWDIDRQLLELQKLTLQRDKDVAAYQAVVQKAWSLASQRFTQTLASAPKPEAQQTWRSFADRWLAVANDTLIEVHRSDEFVEAQRRMLRSASDRHLQERRIAEAWCAATHIPTRSEIDELQRHVTELRREVRLLRRAEQDRATDGASRGPARKAATGCSSPSPKRAPARVRAAVKA